VPLRGIEYLIGRYMKDKEDGKKEK
jgi:hypothetical protein